jgi:GntR family transcriptional regulator
MIISYNGSDFLRIIIKNTDGKPIYEQIKEQIKEAILSDEICEGDILPSIRQLARDLRISVITTTRAYTDLEQEGFIAIVQGKGCYVLPKNSELIREQLLRKIEESFSTAVNAARTARLSREELIKMLDIILEENSYE